VALIVARYSGCVSSPFTPTEHWPAPLALNTRTDCGVQRGPQLPHRLWPSRHASAVARRISLWAEGKNNKNIIFRIFKLNEQIFPFSPKQTVITQSVYDSPCISKRIVLLPPVSSLLLFILLLLTLLLLYCMISI